MKMKVLLTTLAILLLMVSTVSADGDFYESARESAKIGDVGNCHLIGANDYEYIVCDALTKVAVDEEAGWRDSRYELENVNSLGDVYEREDPNQYQHKEKNKEANNGSGNHREENKEKNK